MFYKKKYKDSQKEKQNNKKSYNIRKSSKDVPQLYNSPLSSHIGNQEIMRMFRQHEIMAKLFINNPGDSFEVEADTIAEKIVNLENSKQKKIRK